MEEKQEIKEEKKEVVKPEIYLDNSVQEMFENCFTYRSFSIALIFADIFILSPLQILLFFSLFYWSFESWIISSLSFLIIFWIVRIFFLIKKAIELNEINKKSNKNISQNFWSCKDSSNKCWFWIDNLRKLKLFAAIELFTSIFFSFLSLMFLILFSIKFSEIRNIYLSNYGNKNISNPAPPINKAIPQRPQPSAEPSVRRGDIYKTQERLLKERQPIGVYVFIGSFIFGISVMILIAMLIFAGVIR